MSPEYRESLALKMVEDEGISVSKKLEKTDVIAKISPAVGLMGTLIPLGPGLTALGAGDIQNLAQHLLIAFDAAVLGMASAAIAFTVSKIRAKMVRGRNFKPGNNDRYTSGDFIMLKKRDAETEKRISFQR